LIRRECAVWNSNFHTSLLEIAKRLALVEAGLEVLGIDDSAQLLLDMVYVSPHAGERLLTAGAGNVLLGRMLLYCVSVPDERSLKILKYTYLSLMALTALIRHEVQAADEATNVLLRSNFMSQERGPIFESLIAYLAMLLLVGKMRHGVGW
jgi:hypothetical protein